MSSPSTLSSPSSSAFLLPIVGGAAFAHLLNDMIQAVMPAIFPMLKLNFSLSFGQIGMIALVYQITASLLQPWIGFIRISTLNLICCHWVWWLL